jgi:carbonic anhydrase
MGTSLIRKIFPLVLLLVVLFPPGGRAGQKEESTVPPGEALFRLRDGNDRFTSSRFQVRDYIRERKELMQSQHPYAIVLTCSDSRVPPEIIFDESLGKLFVLWVAGNVLDPALLGSIEYAAEHLHVSLILMMGHESCGAVKAALSGIKAPENLDSLIKK